jgi:hypothetical protein
MPFITVTVTPTSLPLMHRTDELLWKTKVDSHVVARITAGLRYYNGKVFVPVSSL